MNATTPVLTDAAGALAFLGPWGAVAALALQFGVPFVTKLFENAAKGTDPTPEEWSQLKATISIPGEVLIPQRPV